MWAFMPSSRSPVPLTRLSRAASNAVSQTCGTAARSPAFQA